ncbi:hypothetical protein [Chitinophaga sp. MM2321]|uniref:hypothetical protein n=1 Tax=Chitinophaga sp. MM2321 TaxID=3137178 RepID=UPI0032D5922F
MKTAIIILLGMLLSFSGNAQILGSLFSQKKENRKLLGQQIAALQIYKTYLKKGYSIASKGLNLINKIKTGDFDLHRDFFSALKFVNPGIKKYGKVAEMIALNVQCVKQLKQIGKSGHEGLFNMMENRYIQQVVNNTLEILANALDELMAVVADNQMEMSDAERIKRVDALYEQAKEHYAFTKHFLNDISLYARFKEKENSDQDQLKLLYGLALDQ